jgi:hypothetical protein
LCAALSIPLIQRKIPLNALYGVRSPESFASEENRYAINEFGGRKLLNSSYVWFAGGIVVMIVPYIAPPFVGYDDRLWIGNTDPIWYFIDGYYSDIAVFKQFSW